MDAEALFCIGSNNMAKLNLGKINIEIMLFSDSGGSGNCNVRFLG